MIRARRMLITWKYLHQSRGGKRIEGKEINPHLKVLFARSRFPNF
jgi:hypothetical protein